jgi:hypothetical protein
LVRTLHAIAPLRPLTPVEDDDDMPEDIDEFRRAVARRIRAFIERKLKEKAEAAGAAALEPDATAH